MRNAQHATDVVESIARVVGRQKIDNLEVESKEITDRVSIFRAVQPVEACRTTGVWSACGGTVKLVLQPADELVLRCLVGTGETRWRHHTGPDLAHHPLPLGCIGGDVPEIHRVEGDAGCPEL